MEAQAYLRNVPVSARKMRMVADLVRGERVGHALALLRFQKSPNAQRLEKLLLSAVANWQAHHEKEKMEEADLCIKTIQVNSGRILKRFRPAPQGRAHRIRKRSHHVYVCVRALATKKENAPEDTASKEKEPQENQTAPQPKAKALPAAQGASKAGAKKNTAAKASVKKVAQEKK